ncbi:MAG TPA: MarR family transcriptional regulator [Streptosporangiaceae bacterium]
MGEPRWLNDDEQRTWRAFLSASQLLIDQLDRELQRDADMPHAYFTILVVLSESPGRKLRMGELAELTWSSASRLSHAVTRLEQRGWVRRAECASDKRGHLAEITDLGMRVLEAAAEDHVTGVRAHLFDLLTDEQAARLREISEVILGHLGEHHPAAVRRARSTGEPED